MAQGVSAQVVISRPEIETLKRHTGHGICLRFSFSLCPSLKKIIMVKRCVSLQTFVYIYVIYTQIYKQTCNVTDITWAWLAPCLKAFWDCFTNPKIKLNPHLLQCSLTDSSPESVFFFLTEVPHGGVVEDDEMVETLLTEAPSVTVLSDTFFFFHVYSYTYTRVSPDIHTHFK